MLSLARLGNLNTIHKGGVNKPWYLSPSFLLAGILPNYVSDFANERYYNSVDGARAFPYTFTRASNAVTFDANGDMVWADANMFTYSDDTTNAIWSKTDTTISSAGETSPSGAASTLATEGTAGTAILQQQITGQGANSPYVYSAELKRGNSDWVRMYAGAGANDVRVWFNLATGEVGTTQENGAAVAQKDGEIVDLGNGYYRCTLYAEGINSTTVNFFTGSASANASNTRVNNHTRIIGRQQLELYGPNSPRPLNQSVASPYYSTCVTHDPVTRERQGLIIEEQITNLCPVTGEQYDKMSAPTGGFYVPNPTTTIFGRRTTVFQGGNSGPTNYFIPFGTAGTPAASTLHTISVFVKAGTRTKCQLTPSANFSTTDTYANFDIVNGTVLATGAGASNVIIRDCGNGVFYIALSFTTIAVPASGAALVVGYIQTDTAVRLVGNVTANEDTIVVFGGQLKSGTEAFGFVPCYSTTATRAADEFAETIGAWLDQTKATVYVSFIPGSDISTSRRLWSISDGTTSNGYSATRTTTRTTQIPTASAGATNFGTGTGNTCLDRVTAKHAAIFTGGTTAKRHVLNGGTEASNTTNIPSSRLTLLKIGRPVTGLSNGLAGILREIRIYPDNSATQAQLQTLTSIS